MTPDRLYAVLSQVGRGPQNAQFLQAFLGDQSGITIEAGKTARIAVRMDLDTGRGGDPAGQRRGGRAVSCIVLARRFRWTDINRDEFVPANRPNPVALA